MRGYVSTVRTEKMIRCGYQAYLVFVLTEPHSTQLTISNVPVVKDYQNVFPDELARLPPEREIDFTIEVQPGVDLISIPPYQMALKELRELEVKLRDMLDKGFIRPSVSS